MATCTLSIESELFQSCIIKCAAVKSIFRKLLCCRCHNRVQLWQNVYRSDRSGNISKLSGLLFQLSELLQLYRWKWYLHNNRKLYGVQHGSVLWLCGGEEWVKTVHVLLLFISLLSPPYHASVCHCLRDAETRWRLCFRIYSAWSRTNISNSISLTALSSCNHDGCGIFQTLVWK